MRKPSDPMVLFMWCLVAALGLIGLTTALASMVWGSG